jgi:hypothetical protein
MCFVFVLLFSNVTATGQTTVTGEPANESDFGKQMDEITLDFRHSFKNVFGERLEQDKGVLEVMYRSRVPLEGAEEVNLFVMGDDFPVLNALFSGSPDTVIALKECRELVRKIEALTLTCCILSKNEEQVDGNVFSQTFWVSYVKGKPDVAYQDMVIMVKLAQTEVFEGDGFVDFWCPMLIIYKP